MGYSTRAGNRQLCETSETYLVEQCRCEKDKDVGGISVIVAAPHGIVHVTHKPVMHWQIPFAPVFCDSRRVPKVCQHQAFFQWYLPPIKIETPVTKHQKFADDIQVQMEEGVKH